MTSRTALLRLHYFVAFAAIGAFNPFFPTWLRARGIEGIAMSALTTLSPLLGIVSPVVFGVAADRFGFRGSLLRVAALGAFLPFALLTALTWTTGHVSYAALFPLVAMYAFFRGPLVSLADATALEEPGSYARTRRFGSLGFLAMAVVAGFVIDVGTPWKLPAAVAAPLLCTFIAASRIRSPEERATRPETPIARDVFELLRSGDYLLLLGSAFLWNAAHVSYDLCFSLHLKDLGASSAQVGLSWGLGVVAEIVLMTYAPRLFASRPAVRLLAVGVATTALRLAVLSQLRSLPVLFALQPLHAITFGLTWISGLELVKSRAPAHVLATAQSAFAVAAALGSTAGMFVWGPLYARSGGGAVFVTAAAVAALGCSATLALALVRTARRT